MRTIQNGIPELREMSKKRQRSKRDWEDERAVWLEGSKDGYLSCIQVAFSSTRTMSSNVSWRRLDNPYPLLNQHVIQEIIKPGTWQSKDTRMWLAVLKEIHQ